MKLMWGAAGCVAAMLFAGSTLAGEPIQGNAGKFMSPFTTDGTTAGWITKSMQVKAAGQIGSLAGQYAGQKAMEQVPFVGGMLGKKAGEKLGREMALKAIGGEEFLRSSSDLSFETPQDMADYIKANHAEREDLSKILQATYAIYPELQTVYPTARRPAPYGKALSAAAPGPGGFDFYKFEGKAGRVITVDVQGENMRPMVSLNSSDNKKGLGGGSAPKGASQVSFNTTLPADGEYVVMVSQAGLFKGAAAGRYVLKVTDPEWEREEAARIAAEKAAAAKKAAPKKSAKKKA
jgi:hypothetical protein